jgi:TrmH family RNA methyltransferase
MITSAQNPKIQAVRELLSRPRARREAGAFAIEGVRLAEEAVASGWPLQQGFYSENISPRGQAIVQRLIEKGVPIEPVSTGLMQSLADTETSQGLLLILEYHPLAQPESLDFAIVVDAIRDPGNLGALLRTAWAAAVQAVLLAPTTTDPFAPKVLRAAMGAHFHLPILSLDWPALRAVLKERPHPLEVYLAEANQGAALWQADFRAPVALLIGGEAEGPGPQARQLAGQRVHIPMPGDSESLNAAAAAAVLLFEVVRQRHNIEPALSKP